MSDQAPLSAGDIRIARECVVSDIPLGPGVVGRLLDTLAAESARADKAERDAVAGRELRLACRKLIAAGAGATVMRKELVSAVGDYDTATAGEVTG